MGIRTNLVEKISPTNVKKETVKEIKEDEVTEIKEDVEVAVESEAELRKKIKELGIQLVQRGKSVKVKKLTAEYGCTKMDDLPVEFLEEYLAKLEKL